MVAVLCSDRHICSYLLLEFHFLCRVDPSTFTRSVKGEGNQRGGKKEGKKKNIFNNCTKKQPIPPVAHPFQSNFVSSRNLLAFEVRDSRLDCVLRKHGAMQFHLQATKSYREKWNMGDGLAYWWQFEVGCNIGILDGETIINIFPF